MKILVAQQRLYRLGGSEQAALAMIEELVVRGHDVEVFAPIVQKEDHYGLSQMAAEVSKLAPVVGRLEGSYDRIFVAHQPIARRVAQGLLHHSLTGFATQTCHGIFPRMEQHSCGLDAYVAISDEVWNHLQSRGVSSTVIHNGVNCDRYKPRTPINRELKTVLSLVQTGPAMGMVKRVCKKLGLKYLHCHKINTPTWDIENLMNEADLVVSLGRGAYEAMACGRAVVVLDSREYAGEGCLADGIVTEGNWQELLKFNFSGRRYRIEYDDADLIAEFAKYTSAMGEVNRQIALETFNIRHQVGKYLALGDSSK